MESNISNISNIEINDLRTAIDFLKNAKNQLVQTDTEVDPHAELAGVYRHIGAGGTVQRPTRIGPAMIFNNVKGYPNKKVIIGLLSSRERVAMLLGAQPDKLGFLLNDAVKNCIEPIVIENSMAPCQEIIHYASDPNFDIRKILPAPTNTEEDAGPYITLGMCYASHPESGEGDVTIHRLCLQSKDEISMFFTPGIRHLDAFRKAAEDSGNPLPISISIGVDPAIEIAEKAIASAEYVIEGELIPRVRIREDKNTNTGKAMPEFPGYTGEANEELPLIKVKAITHRINPIMQTCIGPSEEHVNMAGIPVEASIIQMVERAMPGRLINVYAHSAGGGKYMAILQFKKSIPSDEGRQRQAALLAFSAFPELKNIILVDEDVDPFDSNDVLWALNTRYQGDIDTIFIPGVRCHPLDPSENPCYNPMIRDNGISCKTIFDCTVPYDLKERFKRSKFMDVDLKKFNIKSF
jgi:4-hydroxy-3-polyprenylbenzoate decarboxylase